MNWRRENSRSTERASAFASIVFPTPGKSSMIRCPSATRQSTQSRSVSAGACTTLRDVAAIRSTVCRGARLRRAGISMRFHRASSTSSRRSTSSRMAAAICGFGARGTSRSPSRVTSDDLVLVGVEADPVAAHVVVDDEIDVLVVRASPASARARPAPALRAEADEHLAVAARARRVRRGRLRSARARGSTARASFGRFPASAWRAGSRRRRRP